MASYDLFLFPIFKELRRLGMPLGVSDYLLVLEAFRSGIGLGDEAVLHRLCNLLWAKSQEDQVKVDVVFSILVEPLLQSMADSLSTTEEEQEGYPGLLPFLAHSADANLNQLEEREVEQQEVEAVLENHNQQHIALQGMPLYQPPKKNDFSPPPLRKYFMIQSFPLDYRDTVSSIRQLRHLRQIGLSEELDVAGTIQQICRIGFFLKPVLQPQFRNQAQLILLLDQQGSMTPFTSLTGILLESIMHVLPDKTNAYYFHDYPENVLYEQVGLIKPRPLEEVLVEQIKDRAVLIISDAGAARGRYDGRRVASTKEFLKTLSTYTYLYAWLNPMPPNRWIATTAEDIAHIVPMFPLTREGLIDSIAILQGHPFPPGISIDG